MFFSLVFSAWWNLAKFPMSTKMTSAVKSFPVHKWFGNVKDLEEHHSRTMPSFTAVTKARKPFVKSEFRLSTTIIRCFRPETHLVLMGFTEARLSQTQTWTSCLPDWGVRKVERACESAVRPNTEDRFCGLSLYKSCLPSLSSYRRFPTTWNSETMFTTFYNLRVRAKALWRAWKSYNRKVTRLVSFTRQGR